MAEAHPLSCSTLADSRTSANEYAEGRDGPNFLICSHESPVINVIMVVRVLGWVGGMEGEGVMVVWGLMGWS